MSKRLALALVVEAVLVVAVVVFLAGRHRLGPAAAAFGLGAGVVGLLTVPSVLVLLWGRERSHGEFMTAVGGVLLGKFALIGASLLFVWARTDLPRLEYVFGLMAGWVASFVLQVIILRVTLPRHQAQNP